MAQRLKTDWILFFTIVAMVVFGITIVTSASSVMAELKYKASYYFVVRQAAWAVVSFIVLMYFKGRDYRRFFSPVWAFTPLGIVLASLVIVYFADPRRHRWLNIGTVGIQPSEFAKPALIIFLAYFIAVRLRAINHRGTLLPALLAAGLLGAVVVIADLGTAIVLVSVAVVLFYIAGLDRKYLVFAGMGAVLVVLIAIASKPYRLARIVGKFDPSYTAVSKIDPSGRFKAYIQSSLATRDPSYQARQSRIAVGAGGAFGVGLAQGKQKLLYLPEAHTDFIYAVVGEELGL